MSERLSSCCTGLYELPLTRLLLGSSFHPGGLALTDRLARATALGPTDRVLDLASGRGTSALHLANKFGCHVTALDLSSLHVAELSTAAKARGLESKITAVHGDATALEFSSSAFDVVLTECALCTFPDRERALREAHRVLKKGGMIGLSDVTLSAAVPCELDTLLGKVVCVAGALPLEGYVEALTAAGFRRVRSNDESSVLQELIDQVDTRLTRLREGFQKGSFPGAPEFSLEGQFANIDAAIGLPPGELDATMKAARRFIAAGGVGYATVTGRR